MKYLQRCTILLLLIFLGFASAAQEKQKLTFDDILKWNRITEKEVSNEGSMVAYKLEPWKGDPVLKVVKEDGSELLTQTGGTDIHITEDSEFIIARVKPLEDTVRQLKLEGKKKEELPMDELLVFNTETMNKEMVDCLKSIKVPEKWSGWIAYQTETKSNADTTDKDQKQKKESKKNGYVLTVENLSGGSKEFPFVTEYVFAKEERKLAFVSTGDKKEFEAGVYHYNLEDGTTTPVMTGKAKYKKISYNEDGSLLAFVSDSTSTDEDRDFSLYLWKGDGEAREIVHGNYEAMPEKWTVNENGNIRFTENNERMFFGTAPMQPKKDTTKLEEEIPKLDVWHWDEPILHSVQLENRKEKLNKSYLAVYHLNQDRMVQLETKDFTDIQLINEGNADKVLAWSFLPYGVQRMWEGYPYHTDFYLVDMHTGEAEMFKEDCRAKPDVSPAGKYIYWYNAKDTSWVTYNIETGNEHTVTRPETIQCAYELHDTPNMAYPYGTPGWTEGDESLLVYDQFDIWKVDPDNEEEAVNLTVNGRETNTKYRLIDYRTEEEKIKGLDPSDTHHLHGHNIETRGDGYYETKLKQPEKPEKLMAGKYRLSSPVKAKDEKTFVYTKETFQRFPDLLITDNFRKSTQLSNANPQQEKFKWGTAELYSWTSADGKKLDGLLIKPEDFDPNKKYPLIVNFYEKSSQGLYRHRTPEADRSTVGYHYYTSKDYIIFNPDVYYSTGYPGQDAFDCVIPGVTKLISEGFIDKEHIAAQGHSWGGYQVAYLATQTDLFAAIESGAPVSNMFSAYGGIRGWSGRNRSFQYENTQSRIGGSIWEKPLNYLENSPLFWANKINTPMLIMHNEDDGAVPFSQGVEFFIALRRLRKPAWLLNYNEADHWPTKIRDKKDFQIRMSQFFDHYLKEKPMPEWMQEGIPATEKKTNMGYELME